MRALITLVSLVAATYFAWQYRETLQSKAEVESRLTEAGEELEAAKIRLAQLTGRKPVENSMEQRNQKR